MPISRDMQSRSSAAFSINPATISSDTTTAGSGVDVSGAAAVVIRFFVGTRTDGTYTPDVQVSDDNSTWSDAAAFEIIGSETAISASNTIVSVGLRGNVLKKYVRARIVSASTTSGATACGAIVEQFTS